MLVQAKSTIYVSETINCENYPTSFWCVLGLDTVFKVSVSTTTGGAAGAFVTTVM